MSFCVICCSHSSGEERNNRRVKVLLAPINHHDVTPGWGGGVHGFGKFIFSQLVPSLSFFERNQRDFSYLSFERAPKCSVSLTFYSMINAAGPQQPGNMAETRKRTDWECCCGKWHANQILFYESDPGLLRFHLDGKWKLQNKKEKASLQPDTKIYVHAGAELSERLPGMGILL